MSGKEKISQLNDQELISGYTETQQDAYLSEIYERYTSFVFFISMKYLKIEDKAKDATMQVFEKLIHELARHEIKNFKGWLHAVTRNHCLHLLREKPLILENDEKKFVEKADVLYLDDEEDKEERISKLERALEQLSDEQKTCIELFYLKGMSYKECSEQSGYDLKKVKSHIQNGKRNLKLILMKKNE